MSFRIGVDIGGTFTDFTVVKPSGEVLLWKEDTTPDDPARAIAIGLNTIAKQLGMDTNGLLSETHIFVHGTTVATNMVIERNGPTIGLLCTKGFRDILYFRDGYKPDRFNIHMPHPQPFVDRWLSIGVPERIDRDGNEITPLDEDAVRAAADRFRQVDVKAIAVSFLWSMMSPQHELRAAEILQEELPSVHVICSHAVLPEIREWERTSATVLSAYILPRVVDYLRTLEERLSVEGLDRPLLVMQINGGCGRVTDLLQKPVNILDSGPAAAPAAALHFMHKSKIGNNLITCDMGGTSLDVCVIKEGHASMSRNIQVENQPIGVPAVESHSIGAGGGSIAWVDNGGALRVGPSSAGSRPGPACYDMGGNMPTVTDANVILGKLAPEAFLGGRRVLREDLAEIAINEHVAQPLGLSTLEAAAGIISVVNANMAGAIRAVSVEQGVDPRQFNLVCGGGAGGLHAVQLARELGIQRVFVPLEAGVLCSFGMTVTDVRHDHVDAYHAISDNIHLMKLNHLFAELETKAKKELLEEGFEEHQIYIERFVDARYPGQIHELTIPVSSSSTLTEKQIEEMEANFHSKHETQFAYSRREMPVECLHWRVVAMGRQIVETDVESQQTQENVIPQSFRSVYFDDAKNFIQAPVYNMAKLGIGCSVKGPAIIIASTTTVVIHPGDILSRPTVDGFVIDVAKSCC